MRTVLVTDKEYKKAIELFSCCRNFDVYSAPSDENALAETVRKYSARCVIVGVEQYSKVLYESLQNISVSFDKTKTASYGSLIARFGVGHDGIDKLIARQFRIAVTNTPGALSRSVAEHTFWLMGALLRNVTKADRTIRNGEFSSFIGSELYGKTLLIIGAGEIGRCVAKIARFGFEMRVFVVDSCPLEEITKRLNISPEIFLNENGIERYSADVNMLLPDADIVSLHLASTPQTFHYISRSQLDLMKSTSVLINTARGTVLDEIALYEALLSSRISGAGLDVFETEPYQPVAESADLRTLNNVVLTPHLASSSFEANHRMAESTLRNVQLFFEGKFNEMNLVQY
jgi:lactate dehydrogenase-like 2-hydroxyacid dehydrogenase